MRIGINPEKFKGEENKEYQHRVIVVCYIPNSTEDYYQESLEVLKKCLESLVATVNTETTCISLLNNQSIPEVDILAKEYLSKKQLDKYVLYSENKGKVYAVIDEARGVYEPYVTITDCDVLFMNHWEKDVFDIFKNHPKAGVVSPVPSPGGALSGNENVFFDKYLWGGISYGKYVSDKALDLYLQGINNPQLFNRHNKPSWKEKQYVLSKPIPAVIGATHFVATYKSYIFKDEATFPRVKFRNGYEENFIDQLASYRGLYRLSTTECLAYHIGNAMDDFTKEYLFLPPEEQKKVVFDAKLVVSTMPKNLFKMKIKVNFFRVIKRMYKL